VWISPKKKIVASFNTAKRATYKCVADFAHNSKLCCISLLISNTPDVWICICIYQYKHVYICMYMCM